MKITAVIMCSGLSRRMGDNKLLMLFRGRRLFEYAVDAVREAGFWKTVVVTAYEEIAQYCRDMTVVFNPDNEEGIASSIRLGVLNSGDSGGIMFFTADQPFIGVREINRLTEAFGDGGKNNRPLTSADSRKIQSYFPPGIKTSWRVSREISEEKAYIRIIRRTSGRLFLKTVCPSPI